MGSLERPCLEDSGIEDFSIQVRQSGDPGLETALELYEIRHKHIEDEEKRGLAKDVQVGRNLSWFKNVRHVSGPCSYFEESGEGGMGYEFRGSTSLAMAMMPGAATSVQVLDPIRRVALAKGVTG